MDDSGFDRLARNFSISRRRAVRTVFGSLLTGLGLGSEGVAAKPDKPPKPPKDPKDPKDPKPPKPGEPGTPEALFYRVNEPCAAQEECGDLTLCTSGSCVPFACLIERNVRLEGDRNSTNQCQFCDPTGADDAWARWTTLPNDAVCGDPLGDPCVSDFSTCQAGECVPVLLPDGHECGAGQVCCLGSCCEAGLPCNSVTGCGGCYIDGENYHAGATNGAGCQVCDAAVDASAWTTKGDGSACGEDLDRVCCNGECCSPDNCCHPAGYCAPCCAVLGGDGKRMRQVCQPGCLIDGIEYADGTPNPGDSCSVCSAGVSGTSWTGAGDNLFCGPNQDRFCCNGVCCAEPGACCNALGVCEVGGSLACSGCVIGGAYHNPYTLNPANTCELCAPELSRTSWSFVPHHRYCDGGRDRICCNGTCCAAGQVCVLELGPDGNSIPIACGDPE